MRNMQEFVIFFEDNGRILYANELANQLLGYKNIVDECEITDIFQTEFHTEDGRLTVTDASLFKENMNMNAYRRNSTCFPVCGNIVLTTDPHVMMVIGYDATTRVYLDRISNKAEQEIEDTLKVRSEFVANVTHELRTPVNGILGNTRELAEMEEDAKKQKLLGLIERGCGDMNAIINNILDFSKLDAGKFTLEPREFEFREMIEYVKSNHKNKISEKGVELLVAVSPDIPKRVIGDELRIVQILNNLLSNATKFTSVGRIVLEAVKTAEVNNRIELFFMVIDTGIGIDKAGQEKLFKSFSQVDASISRRFGGTGLGLSITKQLVELMDGRIQVESELGKGSMFSFYIWVDVPQGQEEQEPDKSAMLEKQFTPVYHIEDTQKLYEFGTKENLEEIQKKMSKLILSIELENWEKAELFMDAIRTLLEQAPEDIKRAGLRLKMMVQKEDHDKTVTAYDKLEQLLDELGNKNY